MEGEAEGAEMYVGDANTIRKRRADSGRPNPPSAKEEIPDTRGSKPRRSFGGVLLVAVFVFLAAAGFDGIVVRRRKEFTAEPERKEADATPAIDFTQCGDQLPKISASEPTRRIEPLWLPNYPTSLPGSYSAFLTELTGLPAAAKNYYRQSRSLRRCHVKNNQPNLDSVTCEIVHVSFLDHACLSFTCSNSSCALPRIIETIQPIIPADRPHPSAQAAGFGKAVLVAIRNPLTAYPAFHQEKSVNYHGVQGQVSESEWNEFRDEWFDKTLWKEWRGFVEEWRKMEAYFVKLYLPYESWSDEVKGPDLVEKIADALKQEEFPVLVSGSKESAPSNLACLWHSQIRNPMAIAEEQHRTWYTAQYTSEQLKKMADDLDEFARDIKSMEGTSNARPGDDQLISILTEYRDAVKSRSG